MKQRTEKESRILTSLPEYKQYKEQPNLSSWQMALARHNLDVERSKRQIDNSMIKRDDSVMAVHKSMAAIEKYYRNLYGESVLPGEPNSFACLPDSAATGTV